MGGGKLYVKVQIWGLSVPPEYSYSDFLWNVMCLQKTHVTVSSSFKQHLKNRSRKMIKETAVSTKHTPRPDEGNYGPYLLTYITIKLHIPQMDK